MSSSCSAQDLGQEVEGLSPNTPSRGRQGEILGAGPHCGGCGHGTALSEGFPGLTGVSEAAASPRTSPTPLGLGSWTRNGWESCPPLPKGQNHVDGAKPPTQKPFCPRRVGPGRAAHHMLCLQVPPQLLPQVLGAEFHGGRRGRPGAGRTPDPTRVTPLPLVPLLQGPLLPPLLRRP